MFFMNTAIGGGIDRRSGPLGYGAIVMAVRAFVTTERAIPGWGRIAIVAGHIGTGAISGGTGANACIAGGGSL